MFSSYKYRWYVSTPSELWRDQRHRTGQDFKSWNSKWEIKLLFLKNRYNSTGVNSPIVTGRDKTGSIYNEHDLQSYPGDYQSPEFNERTRTNMAAGLSARKKTGRWGGEVRWRTKGIDGGPNLRADRWDYGQWEQTQDPMETQPDRNRAEADQPMRSRKICQDVTPGLKSSSRGPFKRTVGRRLDYFRNQVNDRSNKAIVRLSGTWEKGALAYVEYLGVSQEDSVKGPRWKH